MSVKFIIGIFFLVIPIEYIYWYIVTILLAIRKKNCSCEITSLLYMYILVIKWGIHNKKIIEGRVRTKMAM